MNKTRLIFNALAICALFLAGTSLANAQSSRTWVSATGSDANPCSRTAPCQTFSGAFSKTFINGEIDAIDPGGYGTVTISKSITLDGTGTLASILSSGVTGITVNITSSANDPLNTVRLRGISINGTGASGTIGTRTGLRGINISTANATQPKVIVEDVLIEGFVNEGILFASNGGHLSVSRSSIRNNGTAGIRADSFGANTNFLTITDTLLNHNAQEGVRIEDRVKGTMTFSSASNGGLNGVTVIATVASEFNVDNSTIANNGQNGVFAINATSTIRVTNNEITNNVSNGLSISTGGLICSNAKNRITAPTQAPNCTFNDQ